MSPLSAPADTRYADSLRLSVAPMMDWTDKLIFVNEINKIRY